MPALLEPPPLLAIALIVIGGAVALWVGLRSARAAAVPPPTVPEDREEWGVDDPPLPAKQPYTYPELETEPVREHAPDAAPLPVLTPVPAAAEPVEAPVQALQPEVLPDEAQTAGTQTGGGQNPKDRDVEDDEDEALSSLSPADVYRPRPRAESERPERSTPREEG